MKIKKIYMKIFNKKYKKYEIKTNFKNNKKILNLTNYKQTCKFSHNYKIGKNIVFPNKRVCF